MHKSKMTAGNLLGVDALDIRIITELLNNPESTSSEIAKEFGMPLSTIQRRRAQLERTVLTRKYELNVQGLGWRNAEILMFVENGNADYMAKELINKFDSVTSTSIRIDSGGNLAANVSYQNSDALHELLESVRRIPNITNIQWTEIVREEGDKNKRLARLIFANQDKTK